MLLGLERVEEENGLSGTNGLPDCINVCQYQIFAALVLFKTISRKGVIAEI